MKIVSDKDDDHGLKADFLAYSSYYWKINEERELLCCFFFASIIIFY
jgi:hypothetical protein